jgi:hypothetical protein
MAPAPQLRFLAPHPVRAREHPRGAKPTKRQDVVVTNPCRPQKINSDILNNPLRRNLLQPVFVMQTA